MALPISSRTRTHVIRGNRQAWRFKPWLETLEGRLPPTVTLSVSNPVPFPKPDSGRLAGLFAVTRTGEEAASLLVAYTTQDGTGPQGAHAGTDYVATSGTLIFAPYQLTATITVPILGNNIFQEDKTFTVSLSNPLTGAVFALPQTFGTVARPVAAAAGDFNGDGKPDLAVVNYSSVSVLLNTSRWGRPRPASPRSRPSRPAADPMRWRWGTSTATAP